MRKTVMRQGGIREERLYFGSYELYRAYRGTTQTGERQTLHVMDAEGQSSNAGKADGGHRPKPGKPHSLHL